MILMGANITHFCLKERLKLYSLISRQTQRPAHKLDGRRGEGGHALAADAGEAELLGGGQRGPEVRPGGREGGEVRSETRSI